MATGLSDLEFISDSLPLFGLSNISISETQSVCDMRRRHAKWNWTISQNNSVSHSTKNWFDKKYLFEKIWAFDFSKLALESSNVRRPKVVRVLKSSLFIFLNS